MTEQVFQSRQRSFFISAKGEVPAVREELASLLHSLGYVQQDVFAVRLAAEEAIINAIEHGNKGDATKKVAVNCLLDPRRVEINVTDEGPGFDPASVPDCTLKGNLCKCRGRGIALMRGFMDEVKYSKKGNSIKLIKFNRARRCTSLTQDDAAG